MPITDRLKLGGSCQTAFRAETGQSAFSRPATIDLIGTARGGGLLSGGFLSVIVKSGRCASRGGSGRLRRSAGSTRCLVASRI